MTSPQHRGNPLSNALLAGGIALSLGICAFGAFVPGPSQFFGANRLAIQARTISVLVIVGMSAAAAVAVLVASRRHRAPAWSRRLCFLSPLLVLGALPPLFTRRTGWSELTLLVYLTIVWVVLERLLRSSTAQVGGDSRIIRWFSLPKPRLSWLPWAVLFLAVAYYVVGVSYWSIASHQRFETRVSDLAEFDNLFYNALNGHPFRSPAMTGRETDFATFAHHAHLGLYLLLPFYAIAPGPEALLVIQATLVGTTAVPVFLLGRRRLGPSQGLLISLCFLMVPALARPNFYDFHFTALGLNLSAWLIYAADRVARNSQSVRATALAGLLALVLLLLLVREEFGVGVAYVGLVLAFARRNAWVGLTVFCLGATYFLTMKFFVMPRFGEFELVHSYATLVPEGRSSFRGVVLTLFSNPAFVANHTLTPPKFTYLLHFSVPFAFLWWRRPWLLSAVLPGLAFTFLATDRPPYFSTGFQYNYFFLAYVTAATIYGLESLRPRHRRFSAIVSLLLCSIVASFQFGALLGNREILGGFHNKPLRPLSDGERSRLEGMKELRAMIPPGAAVAATETEGTHLSTRLDLFSIKLVGVPDKAQYVLARQSPAPWEVGHITHVLKSGAFGVEAIRGPFMLLRRGADRGRNDVALRMLGP